MIDVTKMNGSKVTINSDLIVKNLVILYKRECNSIDFK